MSRGGDRRPIERSEGRDLDAVARYNASVTYSGRYGLVHPNAEAAYAAHVLWLRFGDEPDFLAMLDDLYGRTTLLLDAVLPLLHPGSRLEHLAASWRQIVLLAGTDQNTEALVEITRLVEEAIHRWGILSLWAPYSLVYTLATAHRQRVSQRREVERAKRHGLHVSAMDMPEYVPRWGGEQPNARVSSGLTSPNNGGYVGNVFTLPNGEAYFQLSEGEPRYSFYDAGPEGYSVPEGASLEEADTANREYRQRYERVQDHFRKHGMVEPREHRDGPNLDEVIDWLFQRIRPPSPSWAQIAAWINKDLLDRRQFLQQQAEEHPEDRQDIEGVLSRVHKDYSGSAVAQHVNGLRELLMIEREPGMKPRFG